MRPCPCLDLQAPQVLADCLNQLKFYEYPIREREKFSKSNSQSNWNKTVIEKKYVHNFFKLRISFKMQDKLADGLELNYIQLHHNN